jgi:hypothetical protein
MLNSKIKGAALGALGGAAGAGLQSMLTNGEINDDDTKAMTAWAIGGALPSLLQKNAPKTPFKNPLTESVALVVPTLLSKAGSTMARNKAIAVKNQADLNEFKKEYPNYAKYDTLPEETKRSLKYAALSTIPFTGIAYAAMPESQHEDLPETLAGYTALAGISSAVLPSIVKAAEHIGTPPEKIKDLVNEKERRFATK